MDAITVKNTLTREALYQINETSQAQVEQLFAVAQQSKKDLTKTTIRERLNELKKIRDCIFQKQESIVERVVQETGKSRTDALVSEIMGVLDYFDWLIGHGRKILGDQTAHTPFTLLGKKSKIYHEALGVVLIISPWNYPFHISMTTIAASLAAGNSVIFKPSEWTPLHGLFEDLISASALFRPCVQIVYGSGLTASRLIAQGPAKIFFTGSAKTGRKILHQAADLLIPVELELGGKDPMIVFDDVNLERTVAGCLWGAMTNAGQSCTSIEQVLVQRKIYPAFVAKLKEQASQLVINAGDLGDADIGSITTDFQLDIIRAQVAEACQAGAKLTLGGQLLGDDSQFYLPTLIEQATPHMRIMTEETFGPVVTLSPFDTEDEVIKTCNDSEFGLSASVWSQDLQRADRVARALEVGAVSINNVMLTEGNPALPFGGTKHSGFGRVKGAEGLLGMTRSKAILVDKQSAKIEANWYPYTRAKYQLFSRFIAALSGKGLMRWIRFAIYGMKLEALAQKPRLGSD